MSKFRKKYFHKSGAKMIAVIMERIILPAYSYLFSLALKNFNFKKY